LRILSSTPSSFASKPRTITSLSSSLKRSQAPVQKLIYQQRWASTEAQEKSTDGEEEAPVSKLQPTPEEEVANELKSEEADIAASEPVTTEAASEPAADFIAESAAETGAEPRAPAASNYQPRSPQTQSNDGASTGRFQSNRAIDPDRLERMARPKETVYIGNLFFDITEDDLQREMSRFGPIAKCKLLRDSRGLSKG
jgi:nucleolin